MSNENTTNKKMEQIAKTLLEKNKSYNDILSEYFKKNLEENIIIENNKEKDNNEETKKDKIYLMKIFNEKDYERIKYREKNRTKKNNNDNSGRVKSKGDLKLCTSVNKSLTDYYYCCKKDNNRVNSLVEDENDKNNNESSLVLNNINNNKENENINNINNNNNIDNNDNLYLIKFIGNNININIDEYNFNKILKIYKCFMNNINNNINNIIDIVHILSKEYINFILEGKFNLFIYSFNYSIDIIKFIFYQIFIFLNLLFLDEIKNISDNFEITFKSLLLYSSQNFELISKIITNPNLFLNQENKITKNFIGKNKIIFSIIKTLSPKKNNFKLNLVNKEQIDFNEDDYKNILKLNFKLIDEIENETKLNRTKDIRNNAYNKLDKFIINLKNKEFILNKIKIITQKQINDDNLNVDNLLNEINIEDDNNNTGNKNENIVFFSLPESERDDEDKVEFKYTLFIELDETLVHYYEEGENYFVKVRQGTDEFLKTLHDFCEIIIVSTSSKEYTDIILENLNKEKKYVDNAIYKDLCDTNNSEINFEKINRDNKKCIFICHDKKDFFNAPNNNIIELKEFNGEEEDQEIVWLKEELIKLKNDSNNDIENILCNINEIISNNRKNENNNKKEIK